MSPAWLPIISALIGFITAYFTVKISIRNDRDIWIQEKKLQIYTSTLENYRSTLFQYGASYIGDKVDVTHVNPEISRSMLNGPIFIIAPTRVAEGCRDCIRSLDYMKVELIRGKRDGKNQLIGESDEQYQILSVEFESAFNATIAYMREDLGIDRKFQSSRRKRATKLEESHSLFNEQD